VTRRALAVGLAVPLAVAGLVVFLRAESTPYAPPAPSQLPAGWVTVRSKEGGFSVAMPGKPQQQEGQVNGKLGSSTMHAYLFNDTDALYVASWDDLRAAADAAVDPGVAEERARDGMLRKASATIASDREIQVSRYLGHDFVAEGRHEEVEVVLHGRVVLAGQRMYQLMTLTPKTASRGRDVEDFLNSLVLEPR
jgi:hypothetical protein